MHEHGAAMRHGGRDGQYGIQAAQYGAVHQHLAHTARQPGGKGGSGAMLRNTSCFCTCDVLYGRGPQPGGDGGGGGSDGGWVGFT